MRKRVMCAQMITLCLLLTACGGGSAGRGEEELALDIRTEYLGMTSCTAVVDVTADYGQRVYEFTLELNHQKAEETVLTVTAPEDIAGVTARIAGDTATLEYDGVSLETGALDTTGLSPVSAVPVLLNYVKTGFIAEVNREELGETACLRVSCRDPELQPGVGTEGTLWFDLETHALVQGEIAVDGTRVILCEFTQFSMEPSIQQEG